MQQNHGYRQWRMMPARISAPMPAHRLGHFGPARPSDADVSRGQFETTARQALEDLREAGFSPVLAVLSNCRAKSINLPGQPSNRLEHSTMRSRCIGAARHSRLLGRRRAGSCSLKRETVSDGRAARHLADLPLGAADRGPLGAWSAGGCSRIAWVARIIDSLFLRLVRPRAAAACT